MTRHCRRDFAIPLLTNAEEAAVARLRTAHIPYWHHLEVESRYHALGQDLATREVIHPVVARPNFAEACRAQRDDRRPWAHTCKQSVAG
jgi:hypothetical protein